MSVPHVAVGIAVAGLKDHPTIAVGHRYLEPDKPFAGEAGRHVVPVGPVSHLDPEGDTTGIRPLGDDVAEHISGP